MKKLKHIISIAIWSILGFYIFLAISTHVPFIQKFIGNVTANAIEKKIGADVSIGKVNLGFMNRLIVDDIVIKDKNNAEMIKSSRFSVKLDLYDLISGKVNVSSAQIFGLRANLYKADEMSKPNFQFLIDSLRSKDDSKAGTDINIKSLVIRHGAIKYDVHSHPVSNVINPNHIEIKDISSNIALNIKSNGEADINIKSFACKEKSGVDLRNLTLFLHHDKKHSYIKDLKIELPNSYIYTDSIYLSYHSDNKGNNRKIVNIYNNNINAVVHAQDLAFLSNELKSVDNTINISLRIQGNEKTVLIPSFKANTPDGSFVLNTGISIRDWQERNSTWGVENLTLKARTDFYEDILTAFHVDEDIVSKISKTGEIKLTLDAAGDNKDLTAQGNLVTQAGAAKFKSNLYNDHLTADITAEEIDLNQILSDERFGKLTADLSISGQKAHSSLTGIVKGEITNFTFNNYNYKDVDFTVKALNNQYDFEIDSEDPQCMISANGSAISDKMLRHIKINATCDNINLRALNITDRWGDSDMRGSISADIDMKHTGMPKGWVKVDNYTLIGSDNNYSLNKLSINSNDTTILLDSDFGHVEICGNYNYKTIGSSIMDIINSRLSFTDKSTSKASKKQNRFRLNAEIKDTEWLKSIFGIPAEISSPLTMRGSVDDSKKTISLSCNLPYIKYNGSEYKDINAYIRTPNDTLQAYATINKIQKNGGNLVLKAKADAVDDKLLSLFDIDVNQEKPISGTLYAETNFLRNETGEHVAHINIHPSVMMMNNTEWHIKPSGIVYQKDHVIIDHLAIEHEDQYIKMSGLATKSSNDSIVLDLHNVDVSYILNLVDFHAVRFGGLASGQAYIKSAFNNPDMNASLKVEEFKFQDGSMGTLNADVCWNKDLEQIDIDAVAFENEKAFTLINGYISPKRNYIDLGINANNTNIEFVEGFCGSFMSNIKAFTNGNARVIGDLSAVNLVGDLNVDGTIDITPLRTTYTLDNVNVKLIPNEIIFNNSIIKDIYGNKAVVNGALHHKNLGRLTFDLTVEPDNFLCYDHKEYGNNTFYGTVFGTGLCTITGKRGSIEFDINITPQKNSFIEYNAASPDAINNEQFIVWNEKKADSTQTDSIITDQLVSTPSLPSASDLKINFVINANPDFTLRVLMDKTTGDYIALNGTGGINATFYNKGSFIMNGTYQIEAGTYKLTIQNIMKKEFKFQPGSFIVFGGNPYHAALNLKALYTVNGVSLSDLQIGNSFTSNNVRVDCMMNISGTPQAPHVDFDFDLPTVNSDAKQMVRSLINSEEELNQQVIYLLSIGRFYNQNTDNNAESSTQPSQTSLAMQSLLSGTLSQQLNNVLGTLINSNNWNFGANISTGDDGFNNAEYEGILSGRLLNNRLIFNGQFGYRDNENATTSFIGDFDLRYLLYPNGNLAIKVYNQTNDRYFTKSSLNTQGIGLIIKKDFNTLKELFSSSRKKKKIIQNENQENSPK